MTRRRASFVHALDRYDLWRQVRSTPPRDEFGPLVNLGLFQVHAWGETGRVRRFARRATRADLATLIGLLAAIGQDVVTEWPRLMGELPPPVGMEPVMGRWADGRGEPSPLPRDTTHPEGLSR